MGSFLSLYDGILPIQLSMMTAVLSSISFSLYLVLKILLHMHTYSFLSDYIESHPILIVENLSCM